MTETGPQGLIVDNWQFLQQFITEPLYDVDGFMVPPKAEEQPAQKAAPTVAMQPVSAVPNQSVAAQQAVSPAAPQPAAPVAAPAANIPFLGKVGSGVLIIVNEAADVFPPQADLDFLAKILAALKLQLEDVALVNVAQTAHPWPALNQQFRPTRVITFGMGRSGYAALALLQRYIVQDMGAYKVINADSLAAISANENLKRALWNSLKLMFAA